MNDEQMKKFQKAVKYGAMALAILLAVSIFFGIASIVLSIFGVSDAVGEMKTYELTGDMQNLDVEISAADFKITEGDNFSVKSNLKDLHVDLSGGTLKIEDKSRGVFGIFGIKNYNGALLEITLPKGFTFMSIELETGAGVVEIDRLRALETELQLGAGKVNIKHFTALKSASVEGGTGEFNILDGEIADLDFDMGIGECNIRSRLTGNADIDLGVGETNLTLIGSESDYEIRFSKGLGSISYNGKDVEDNQIIGGGAARIDISGGIGALKVEIEN